MKLPKPDRIKWNYIALAFAVPFVGMLINMLIRGSEPFGNVTMLYSDMYHQYYPFFVAFRKALLSGDSLLYTWSIGMGMDYLGLISYYLASPLNLLSVLVPEGWLLEFYCLLMPLKLGFAGMFFAVLLKRLFKKEDLSIVLFGTFYAWCAWALGYQWNIMWLDSFALLPLVALGTVSLLKERKFLLYTCTLFLSVFANYYVGFFTCIFVLLLFICYEICRWRGFRKLFADLVIIGIFSVLAIGMTAILTLPAYAALQTTQSSVNIFPSGFRLNMTTEHNWKGLLNAMRQVIGNMSGGLETTFKEGLPNLYCGVGTVIFAFLFLSSERIKTRDKLCSALLLLFFAASFVIRQLDYIWHGFHFPNMIPYRFSFLYSFVMLYMAYRAYLQRNKFQLWQILVAGLLAVCVMLCSNNLTDPVFLAYNGVFLLLYLAALAYGQLPKIDRTADPEVRQERQQLRKYRQSLSGTILFGIMAVELVMNMINFSVCFPSTGVSNYPQGTTYAASMIRYMEEREADTLFYRAEVTHAQTLNDGALNGYNGISTFTSSANVRATEFMQALGYGAKDTYNRYCFEESSPVANLFLDLKYMIDRSGKDKSNACFEQVHSFGSVSLLKNTAYLPLGFLANAQLINVDFHNSSAFNNFTFQNRLIQSATGMVGDVWQLLTGPQLDISGTDMEINTSNSGYCTYTTPENTGGTLVYRYTSNKEGLACIDLDLSKRNNFSVWKNGVELYSETYSLPQMLSVCDVTKGDVIEIHLTCKSNESGTVRIHCGVLNEDRFRQDYEKLAASTLELTEFRNTYVAGTINCDRDGVLYTSIPQDGNWTARVDGRPAQIVLIGNCMVGLLLSQGYHEISFTYHNNAFSIGWKISLVCAALLVFLYLAFYRPKRKRGKYERH